VPKAEAERSDDNFRRIEVYVYITWNQKAMEREQQIVDRCIDGQTIAKTSGAFFAKKKKNSHKSFKVSQDVAQYGSHVLYTVSNGRPSFFSPHGPHNGFTLSLFSSIIQKLGREKLFQKK
jgi:hypothetical protein